MYRVDYLVGYTGNQNVQITPDNLLKYIIAEGGAVISVNGMTGNVILVPEHLGLGNVDNTADADKHVLSATKLVPGNTINGVLFDGSEPIIVYDHTKLSLDGGVLHGNVILNATPFHPLHLVTKGYVDSLLGSNTSMFSSTIELVGEIGEIISIDRNQTSIPSDRDISLGQTLVNDAGFNGIGSGGNIGMVHVTPPPPSTFVELIFGNGFNSTFVTTHNLDTSIINISIADGLTGEEFLDFNASIIDNNSIEISFTDTPIFGENFFVSISKRLSHNETIQGNDVDTDFTIVHNLNMPNVLVTVEGATAFNTNIIDDNTVGVSFVTPPGIDDEFLVSIINAITIQGNGTDTDFVIAHNFDIPSAQITLTTLNGADVSGFNVTNIDTNTAQISFLTPPEAGVVFLVSISDERINVRIISRSDRGGSGGTGGGSVPDYENMWSTNQISAPDESWTVTEDGHVWLGTRLRKAEDCVWTINEQIVMDHSSAVGGKTDGFFDVLQGDVVKCVSAPDTTGVFCYFIPPRGGSGGSGGTPGPQGPPGPAGPQGEPGPPGTGTGIEFIDTYIELIALSTATAPLKSMYLVKDASADPNVTGDVWALYIRVGEDGTASDWLKIADGGVVTGVGGGHCAPDYENMGTDNLISEPGESWTATQNGYVLLGTELRMFEDCVWTINDRTVMDHVSAVGGKTDNMFAVKQGDIVRCISEQDTSGVFCFFIPAIEGSSGGGSSCVCVHHCSNLNIIDNWGLQNPVNQRGQTEYDFTGAPDGYGLDRWVHHDSRVLVANRSILLTKGTQAGSPTALYQRVEFPGEYSGRTVTLSCILGEQAHDDVRVGLVMDGMVALSPPANDGLISLTYQLPDVSSGLSVAIRMPNASQAEIKAIKLEEGNVSTLLNDPPMNRTKELIRCKQHFQDIWVYFDSNHSITSTHTMLFFTRLQGSFVPMRIIPTVVDVYGITGIPNHIHKLGFQDIPIAPGEIYDFPSTSALRSINNLRGLDNNDLESGRDYLARLFLDANL